MASPKSIKDLAAILREPERILQAVANSVAEDALNLVKDGFRDEQDPYGRQWAPKQAQDGRKTLSGSTGRLKNGWHKKVVSASEVRIAPNVSYADYHQTGTGIHGPAGQPIRPKNGRALKIPVNGGHIFRSSVDGVPKRKMVPDSEGLPQRWKKSFDESATEALHLIFRGKRSGLARLTRALGASRLGFRTE